MKNHFLAYLILCLPMLGISQTVIKVKEVTVNMSKGVNTGFETDIPATALKDVEKDWKRRLTSGSKAKMTETNGEIAVRGIENKDIAARPFNLYSILASTNDGVKLTVWFNYNDTTFFSAKSGKSETTAASAFVRDFAAAEYFLAIKTMHQKERDKLATTISSAL